MVSQVKSTLDLHGFQIKLNCTQLYNYIKKEVRRRNSISLDGNWKRVQSKVCGKKKLSERCYKYQMRGVRRRNNNNETLIYVHLGSRSSRRELGRELSIS
jgi:hypothetical protein